MEHQGFMISGSGSRGCAGSELWGQRVQGIAFGLWLRV